MVQVKLRPITEADLPDYVRWLNDPEVMQFLAREVEGVTLEQEREWFARISSDTIGRHWAIEADGRHIGNCALTPRESEPTASFGIMIGDKTMWDQGCGTAALREVLRVGFAEMGLHRIHLEAFAENGRAIRCYAKCGFRPEGRLRKARFKRGEWRDAVLMALLGEEWEAMHRVAADGLCRIAPEHVDEVLALWAQTDFWPHAGEDRQFVAQALARNREFAFGWRVSGELVATAIGAFDGFRGWIYRVAVHPDYRRRGIASTFVAEVEKRLADSGVRQINLMVYKPNEGAHALYQRLGYEPSEVDVMRKRFAPSAATEEETDHGS